VGPNCVPVSTKAVGATIPDYKAVTIDVPVAGAFYCVDDKKGSVSVP
jgi:hypothetical protein